MFRNYTIKDLVLFVFTQLILHYHDQRSWPRDILFFIFTEVNKGSVRINSKERRSQ